MSQATKEYVERTTPPDKSHTHSDGTKIESWNDGYKVQTNPNGSSITVWPDKTKRTRFANGAIQEIHPDGYTRQTMPDGIKIEKWPDGRKVQTNTNGSRVESFPDGKMVQVMPNGTSLTKMPDGSKIQKNGDGTIIETKTDGTTIATFPSGAKRTLFPDGHSEQVSADGTIIRINKDGTRSQVNPDASRIETDKDGNKVTIHKDGTRVIVAPDGSTMQVNKDGSKIYRRKKKKEEKKGSKKLDVSAANKRKELAMKQREARLKQEQMRPTQKERKKQIDLPKEREKPKNLDSIDYWKHEVEIWKNKSSQYESELGQKKEILQKKQTLLTQTKELVNDLRDQLEKSNSKGQDGRVNELNSEISKLKKKIYSKDQLLRERSHEIQELRASAGVLGESNGGSNANATMITTANAASVIQRLLEIAPSNCVDKLKDSLNAFKTSIEKKRQENSKVQEEALCIGENWARVADFMEPLSFCNVKLACQASCSAIDKDKDTWKNQLMPLVSDIFGDWALQDILGFIDEEDDLKKSENPYKDLVDRVAYMQFLGPPSNEDTGEPTSHVIFEIGAEEIRAGANVPDFVMPLVVSFKHIKDEDGERNWEKIFTYACQRLMGSSKYMKEVRLLIVQGNSLSCRASAEEMVRAAMRLQPLALRVCKPGTTSLMGYGQSGVIIDSGEEFTLIQPIYKNVVLDYASTWIPIGGKHITKKLARMLQSRGYALANDALREIKEAGAICVSPKDVESLSKYVYDLPNGDKIELDAVDRFELTDVLFNPSKLGKPIHGLAAAIHECLQRCPIDTRRDLYKNVIFTGGCCAFEGLPDRVEQELSELAISQVDYQIPCEANASRKQRKMFQYASYMGAHVSLEMSTDDEMYCLYETFEEDPNHAISMILGKN